MYTGTVENINISVTQIIQTKVHEKKKDRKSPKSCGKTIV